MIISGVVSHSGKPSVLTSTMAMVAVPQAYQPIWVNPSTKSDRRLPFSPKHSRPISTEFRPLLQAI